jgi:Na+-driven multidrug efflux pump
MKDVHLVSFILMVGYMILVIIIGAFAWEPISTVFNKNQEIAHFSVLTFQYLAIPYVFFAASSCLKSLFIGTGRTGYYLIPSMVVNLGIYIPVGLMVKLDIWTPKFIEIMQVSIFVFAIDMILSFILVRRLYKRIEIEIGHG